MMLALGLAGCSSVPDSVNPVSWFEGGSDSVIAAGTKAEGEAEAPKDPARGLVADRSNSKYADTIRREVAPTKPLARRAPAATETQTATVPAAQATPVQVAPVQPAPPAQPGPDARAPAAAGTQIADRPAADRSAADHSAVDRNARQQTARDSGPAAPPAHMDMMAPVRPDIPATVADATRRPRLVQSQYESRLAESAQSVVHPDAVDMARSARGEDAPIHLIAPSAQRKVAGKGMAAPLPTLPAATFQVAALDFQAGSANLTSTDRAAIADVVKLYRQTGGVVRVVGIAPGYVGTGTNNLADSSIKRANAVAGELARRGVPASKIMVGADPNPAYGEPVGARIYLDVI